MNSFGLGLILNFTDNATNGMNVAIGTFQRMNATADAMNRSVNESVEAFNGLQMAGVAVTVLGNLVEGAGSAIISVFMRISEQVIDTGSDFEKSRITLETMYKDVDVAQQKLEWLFTYARDTPFEIGTLKTAQTALKAMGLEADKVLPTLDGAGQSLMSFIGDLGAFRPDLPLERIMQGIRNTIGGNVRSLDMILDVDVSSLIGKELTNVEEDLPKLVEALGAEGLMKNLEGTWAVTVSGIMDTWTMLIYYIGQGGVYKAAEDTLNSFFNIIKDIPLEDYEAVGKIISGAFMELLKPLADLAPVLGKAIVDIKDWIKANPELAQTIIKVTALAGGVLFLTGSVMKIAGPLMMMIGVFGIFVNTAGGASAIIGGLGKSLFTFGKMMGKSFLVAFLLVEAYQNNLLGFRDLVNNVLLPVLGNALLAIEGIFTPLGLSGDKLQEANEKGLIPFIASMRELGRKLKTFWDANGEWIMKVIIGGYLAKKIFDIGKGVLTFIDLSIECGSNIAILINNFKLLWAAADTALTGIIGVSGALAPLLALAITGIVIAVVFNVTRKELDDELTALSQGMGIYQEDPTISTPINVSTGGAGWYESQENKKQDVFRQEKIALENQLKTNQDWWTRVKSKIKLWELDFVAGWAEDRAGTDQDRRDGLMKSWSDLFTVDVDQGKKDEFKKTIGEYNSTISGMANAHSDFARSWEDLKNGFVSSFDWLKGTIESLQETWDQLMNDHPYIAKYFFGYGQATVDNSKGALSFPAPDTSSLVPFETTISTLTENTSTQIAGMELQAATTGTNITDNLTKNTEGLPILMTGRGKDTMVGFVNGVNETDVGALAKDKGSAFAQSFRQALGINSPSVVMQEIGAYTIQGLLNGLSGSDMMQFVDNTVQQIKDAFANGNFTLSAAVEFLGTGANEWLKSIGVGGASLGGLVQPVSGSITSNFGYRDDVAGVGTSDHMGLDIGAPDGAPVGAAGAGEVVQAGWNGGYGNSVILDHGAGLQTLYGHLSQVLVSVGQMVQKLQTIGLVGSTGNSTGPHLHFGVMQDGAWIDPSSIYGFARGTTNFGGGLAKVYEEGGELITLPSGTEIVPNDDTVGIAKNAGKAGAYKEMLSSMLNKKESSKPSKVDNRLIFSEGSVNIQMTGSTDADIKDTVKKLMKEVERQNNLRNMSVRKPIFGN